MSVYNQIFPWIDIAACIAPEQKHICFGEYYSLPVIITQGIKNQTSEPCHFIITKMSQAPLQDLVIISPWSTFIRLKAVITSNRMKQCHSRRSQNWRETLKEFCFCNDLCKGYQCDKISSAWLIFIFDWEGSTYFNLNLLFRSCLRNIINWV